ncbi:mitochondrial fission ELM1 family protein [Neptunomonas antarctica]|uniref:Nucleoside-diphosphate sugar epimerase n=1 Tax=Neptunomonas antarctica TaxID=619304 RepID=A0A1N7J0F9_9GAMM|nr:ELM1/GtrOC1 family putative glycosyltransferase [Neptunomonas antarctica]SIS42872.1 hypothetical protein SAMN05421760_101430 [Neptunomonas antarctica]
MSDICIVSDSKPGHFNQSLGLVEAIQRIDASLTYDVCPPVSLFQLARLVIARLFSSSVKTHTSGVKVFVGAGHQVHFTLLIYGWLSGAKTIVLMKPSLPCRWFDLCLIPEHDQPTENAYVIETWGALNRILPSEKQAASGLILIGGPSRHFDWNDANVLAQLGDVLAQNQSIQWVLTTSRRTPDSFLVGLFAAGLSVEVVPYEQTDKDWLPDKLAKAEHCWVSEDSVSMVYEALTAGCRVGLIELGNIGNKQSEGRVVRGLARLRASGRVRTLKQALLSEDKSVPALAEADRCAQQIIKKGWL